MVKAEAKDIWFDNASRAKLQAGINKVADAVGVTLGPRGAALLLSAHSCVNNGFKACPTGLSLWGGGAVWVKGPRTAVIIGWKYGFGAPRYNQLHKR